MPMRREVEATQYTCSDLKGFIEQYQAALKLIDN